MSGLCGWIGHCDSVIESQQVIEKMVRPIVRFDGSNVQTMIGAHAAMAIAANTDGAHIYQKGGLLVGLWGRVKFQDARLNQLLQTEGAAKILADNWQEEGRKILASLVGEFSFCMLNEDSGEVVLAVDRMGTRSLTYQVLGERLIFSSSSDAIIQHPLTKPEIDSQSLYNYVYFHLVPSPGTIYQNQKRLLPGECLVFRSGKVEVHKYWEVNFEEEKKRPFEELKHDLLDLLRSSVREAAGDRPVGAFLSGGTDSSTIAGILGEVSGQPARTYSIGFEAEGYDEMEYARIAARHFSTQHHEYYVTPDDVVAAIPQVAAIFDQPFGNASAIPAFYCARMAHADGVNRILGGDGGDELFGGNERYAKQHLFSLYENFPPVLRRKIIEPLILGITSETSPQLIRKVRSYIEQASIPMPARMETYNLLGRYGYREVFTPEFLATIDPEHPGALLNETYHQGHASSLINRMLAFDWKLTLADNDLPKVVKACELAQMEVAFPLISNEMVAFSAQLEPHLKLKGTKLRYFFKEALRGFLPDEILVKQKHGFGLPFGVWLQDHKPLQDLAADSLVDLKQRKIIRPDFIDKLLSQHLNEHAGYHGTMVWVLMMLEHWYRQR